MSFSMDVKILVTGCEDNNAYRWDVAAIVKEAGINDLLLGQNADKLALLANAT